ncbi:N-acetylmuramic acid 6-phosphate etherase, partial [Vibrio campbellii]
MSDNQLLNTLSKLVSEGRNPDTMDLDSVSTLELVSKINHQDKLVPLAVEKE